MQASRSGLSLIVERDRSGQVRQRLHGLGVIAARHQHHFNGFAPAPLKAESTRKVFRRGDQFGQAVGIDTALHHSQRQQVQGSQFDLLHNPKEWCRAEQSGPLLNHVAGRGLVELGSLQREGLSVAPNARERLDVINGQSEAAAEGTHAASENKSHPRQSRQARGHHAAPLGELSLQLSHGPAASEAHTMGLLIDHQLPQLWAQIHGPVGVCGTTTGGPSTADFQWFVLRAAVEQRCDLRGRGGENS